ncbi:probable asparagine--tRNA ligase, mitochondrial [Daktulosphaira vitifoliae]|uniref:probable asparagine--tRNA ligase, mitochondrial n=1 Tax=Daktulosphaira vitifoliae TaxID=58002 RepID=UPI0021AADF3D|nr:probable asparagine--tRNA ligase, mitochondrial [Daktulosphaira vitifoliae]
MFNVLKQIPNSRFYSSISVKDIIKTRRVGCKFLMKGWARAIRKMKDNIFVDLDDGSTYQRLQIVIPKNKIADTLSYGSSFEAHGTLVNNTNNQLEITADFITVHGQCPIQEGYPFAPRKIYQSDYVRQYLHMRPQTASFSSLLRLRNQLSIATRYRFSEDGFIEVNVPVLSSNDCEGAGELFIVKPENKNLIKSMASHKHQCPFEVFFNNQTYLTVSGQLHLECIARSLTKVFTIGPTFRAENSKSRLHLSEFYMIEAEQAFINNIEELLSVIEKTTSVVIKKLLDECSEEINIIRKVNTSSNEYDINNIMKTPYEVISYEKACNVLEKQKNFTKPVIRGKPLTKEHELFLVQYNGQKPIFIIDWPQDLKPFYAKALPNNDSLVSAVDLLCPNVGELCGGSVREDNYNVLEEKLSNIGLQKKLDWYLELRKFGNVSTAGFGIGFERFLQVLLNIQNIKDTIAFPRYPHNCKT